MGVNVPLLLQLPANCKSPPTADDSVSVPPVELVTLPVTVIIWFELPLVTIPPELMVRLPPIDTAEPPEVVPFQVPVTDALPVIVVAAVFVFIFSVPPLAMVNAPAVNALAKALKAKVPVLLMVSVPLRAAAP